MKELFKSYLMEYIGTFFLSFTVLSVILLNIQPVIPAIAIGLILMIMVYAGGHISGGFYNPSVTLAAMIRGGVCCNKAIQYITAQILGGLSAGLIIFFMTGIPLSLNDFDIKYIILGEFLFTFALCLVVLLTATSEKTKGNSFFGLAIGSTVTVGIFTVGSICFAAFNPVIALLIGIFKITSWKIVSIAIITELIAALFAALIYKLVENDSIVE